MASLARLLIVEDEPEMAENLVEVLAELGAEADVAASAERALECLAARSYAGIITDQRLPGRAGVELIREMRQQGVHTPVVLLSGYVDPQTELSAEEAGALEVLAKPLRIDRLRDLLDTFARTRVQVLVVEDSRELADNVATALHELGLDAIVAHSAEEALAQHGLPRVAVLDICLPDASGLEVARRLAARDPGVRVLFITGFAEGHLEQVRALAEAVPGLDPREPCIEKPCDLGELIHRVQVAAGLR
ncbi:MAG: response regulator [Polyangiaceae bacterium]|nr:response regulator [Polyangiaceae bacterium]MCE7888199.1 response regulator [Sorangiineae bacterium PRO1]MCL4749855.1 response regulator [Myxococcales bacterium]